MANVTTGRVKRGILGASFDPVTFAHLYTGRLALDECGLDQVILMPGSSKRTDKNMHIDDQHRLNMVQLAIEGRPEYALDDHEMHVAQGYQITYYTMKYLHEKYPHDDLYFIMGADLLEHLHTWGFAEELVANNKFIVVSRATYKNGMLHDYNIAELIGRNPLLRHHRKNFEVIHKGILIEHSSSFIREELEGGRTPEFLLPDPVLNYIKANKLYGYQGR